MKEVITEISCTKEKTIQFRQSAGTLTSSMKCPGPMINGCQLHNCAKAMLLKQSSDRNDGLTWRCRKVHNAYKNDRKYTIKIVKVSIRTDPWISDSNLPLNIIVELIYLWSQRFTNSEIQHELKLIKQTIIEWSAFFREVCLHDIFDNSEKIGGEGIKKGIDESKFGKCKHYRGHKVDGQWVLVAGKNIINLRYLWSLSIKGMLKLCYQSSQNGLLRDP